MDLPISPGLGSDRLVLTCSDNDFRTLSHIVVTFFLFDKESTPIHWLAPHMPAMDGLGLDQEGGQELCSGLAGRGQGPITRVITIASPRVCIGWKMDSGIRGGI